MEFFSKKICENCGKEHNGDYGSGRFCSKKCTSSFIIKQNNKNNSKEGGWNCICGLNFRTKRLLTAHRKECSVHLKSKTKEGGWDCICGLNFRTKKLLVAHRKECIKHLEFINKTHKKLIHFDEIKNIFVPYNLLNAYLEQGWQLNANKEYSKNNTGKIKDLEKEKERRMKISASMKKAVKEGRNKGWATTRKQKGGMSYPELYFETCIRTTFRDKKYEFNYPVGKYKLDFAWVDKKIYIEIDGEQHYINSEIIKSDEERTDYLKNNNWTLIYRIRWSIFQKLSKDEKKALIKNIESLVFNS